MSSPTELLVAQIRGLPGVSEGASRFGAKGRAAWFVAGKEFAHLHADDLLDLWLARALQASLKDDPRARFRKSRSEWLEFEFHSSADVKRLAELARCAWAAAGST